MTGYDFGECLRPYAWIVTSYSTNHQHCTISSSTDNRDIPFYSLPTHRKQADARLKIHLLTSISSQSHLADQPCPAHLPLPDLPTRAPRYYPHSPFRVPKSISHYLVACWLLRVLVLPDDQKAMLYHKIKILCLPADMKSAFSVLLCETEARPPLPSSPAAPLDLFYVSSVHIKCHLNKIDVTLFSLRTLETTAFLRKGLREDKVFAFPETQKLASAHTTYQQWETCPSLCSTMRGPPVSRLQNFGRKSLYSRCP